MAHVLLDRPDIVVGWAVELGVTGIDIGLVALQACIGIVVAVVGK